MSFPNDQTVYLAAVFTAAAQVDKLAHTGRLDEEVLECLVNSLLVVDPPHALATYGGSDRLLKSGYELMVQFLQRDSALSQHAMRYALMLTVLERKIFSNKQMMRIIGDRLSLIQTKVDHFGILNDNVIEGCAQLYADTASQTAPRIMVIGEPHILQKAGTAIKIRTLLLAGIRAAMQWQYTGGRRWQLFLQKKKTFYPAVERLEAIRRQL